MVPEAIRKKLEPMTLHVIFISGLMRKMKLIAVISMILSVILVASMMMHREGKQYKTRNSFLAHFIHWPLSNN